MSTRSARCCSLGSRPARRRRAVRCCSPPPRDPARTRQLRRAPPNSSLRSPLATTAPLARAAARVLEAWGIAGPAAGSAAESAAGNTAQAAVGLGSEAGGTGGSDGSGGSPAAILRGRWEATPELWSVLEVHPLGTLGSTPQPGLTRRPGFGAGLAPVSGRGDGGTDTARGDTVHGDTEHSEASLESLAAALTEAAAELTGKPEAFSVHQRPSGCSRAREPRRARRHRRGPHRAARPVRKPRWVPGLRGVAEWVGGDTPLTLDRPAREDFPGIEPHRVRPRARARRGASAAPRRSARAAVDPYVGIHAPYFISGHGPPPRPV